MKTFLLRAFFFFSDQSSISTAQCLLRLLAPIQTGIAIGHTCRIAREHRRFQVRRSRCIHRPCCKRIVQSAPTPVHKQQ